MVASKHTPLISRTAPPRRISVARRKANQSDASTSSSMGVTICQSFALTR